MANVSPGVYTKIFDLSEYVQTVPSTIGFVPIITEKGRDNELILTNSRDFYREFGEPNILYAGPTFGQGPYIAHNFLQESSALYVVRCMPWDTTTEGGGSMQSASYSNLIMTVNIGTTDPQTIADDTTCIAEVRTKPSVDNEAGIDTIFSADGSIPGVDSSGYEHAVVTILGAGRGSWYNRYSIKISAHSNPGKAADGIYILDVYRRVYDNFNMLEENYVSGGVVNPALVSGGYTYINVASLEVSFDPTKVSGGESIFIEHVIDVYFDDLQCKADEDLLWNLAQLQRNGNIPEIDWSLPFTGINEAGIFGNMLENGDDGNLFNDDGTINEDVATELLVRAYNGTLLKSSNELLQEVTDTEFYYFSVVFDAGYPMAVKDSMYSLVTTRKDCVGFADNGDNKSAAAAIARRNGTGAFTDSDDASHAYNSKYFALYESYNKIYDPFTGKSLWISPMYHVANVIPYTDNVSELWYAPAGFNRGSIGTIRQLRYSPTLAERDLMYLNQINPIVRFSNGYVIYGQLTTQRRASALQDINIVRLVLYIKRALEMFCRFYIFELNNNETWDSIKREVNEFLRVIQNKRGLYSFNVDVGATPYEIKTKKLHVNVTLQPTRVVEQIDLNMYIQ